MKIKGYEGTLDICGVEFRVVRESNLEDEKGCRLVGQIDSAGCLIKVADNLPLIRETEVLWHEVLHEISDIGDLRLTERQTLVLARLIFSVLKANKRLREV